MKVPTGGFGLKVECAGILHGLCQAQRVGGRGPRFRGTALHAFEQQPLQGRPRHPAGRGVVRDEERAAGFQPGVGKFDDRAPNRRRNPAVDAVHGDDVELAQVREARGQELVEARLHETDVGELRGLRERRRGHDVGRIEIDTHEGHVRI
jgi:hypothetical protein